MIRNEDESQMTYDNDSLILPFQQHASFLRNFYKKRNQNNPVYVMPVEVFGIKCGYPSSVNRQ